MKKGQKFYVVSQTDEGIERNRKIIEEMRAKELLQKHERMFQINKDGTIDEVIEDKKD